MKSLIRGALPFCSLRGEKATGEVEDEMKGGARPYTAPGWPIEEENRRRNRSGCISAAPHHTSPLHYSGRTYSSLSREKKDWKKSWPSWPRLAPSKVWRKQIIGLFFLFLVSSFRLLPGPYRVLLCWVAALCLVGPPFPPVLRTSFINHLFIAVCKCFFWQNRLKNSSLIYRRFFLPVLKTSWFIIMDANQSLLKIKHNWKWLNWWVNNKPG